MKKHFRKIKLFVNIISSTKLNSLYSVYVYLFMYIYFINERLNGVGVYGDIYKNILTSSIYSI